MSNKVPLAEARHLVSRAMHILQEHAEIFLRQCLGSRIDDYWDYKTALNMDLDELPPIPPGFREFLRWANGVSSVGWPLSAYAARYDVCGKTYTDVHLDLGFWREVSYTRWETGSAVILDDTEIGRGVITVIEAQGITVDREGLIHLCPALAPFLPEKRETAAQPAKGEEAAAKPAAVDPKTWIRDAVRRRKRGEPITDFARRTEREMEAAFKAGECTKKWKWTTIKNRISETDDAQKRPKKTEKRPS